MRRPWARADACLFGATCQGREGWGVRHETVHAWPIIPPTCSPPIPLLAPTTPSAAAIQPQANPYAQMAELPYPPPYGAPGGAKVPLASMGMPQQQGAVPGQLQMQMPHPVMTAGPPAAHTVGGGLSAHHMV